MLVQHALGPGHGADEGYDDCFGRRASLHRVRAATLVLHGGADALAPIAGARVLADGIPGAELHIVAGAGHAVPLEQPQAAARLLIEWIGRHADVTPTAPRRVDVVGERLTRPFALQAGALRNGCDAAVSVGRWVLRRGPPRS